MKVNKKATFVWFFGLSVVTAFAVFCAQLIAKDVGIMAFVATSACMGLFASDDPLKDKNTLFFLNMVVLLLNGVVFLLCPPIRYIALIVLCLDTLYIFSFKSYRKVKKDTFVILGNKVLIPGERFYLWPFFSYNLEVFKKEKDWGTRFYQVITKDGNFMAKIRVKIIFDIPTDPNYLKNQSLTAKRLSDTISKHITSITHAFTLGKTMSEIIGKTTSTPLLFKPITGTIEIEFLGLSVVK